MFKSETSGKLGISQCPGKNLRKGRDGRSHSRDIQSDLCDFKSRGVDAIVCLLNDSELRSIGVNPAQYKDSARALEITLIQYPMIEMGVPQSIPHFHTHLVLPVLTHTQQNKRVLIHCRGGVGRSGLLAACLLKHLAHSPSGPAAISTVRRLRDKRAVETRRQEDFVEEYFSYNEIRVYLRWQCKWDWERDDHQQYRGTAEGLRVPCDSDQGGPLLECGRWHNESL